MVTEKAVIPALPCAMINEIHGCWMGFGGTRHDYTLREVICFESTLRQHMKVV